MERKSKAKEEKELQTKTENLKFINKHFALQPRDISMLQEGKNAVIIFDQILTVSNNNSFMGFYNKLILEKIKNTWYVVDDFSTPEATGKSLASAKNKHTESQSNDNPDEKEIKYLVRKWQKSWESGNMKTYRACYASDFQSQEMDLNAWISHKINVRQKSNNIRIRVDGLRIDVIGNTAKASLVQHYSSSTLKSKGKKTLELKKMEGQWKIFNEIMQ